MLRIKYMQQRELEKSTEATVYDEYVAAKSAFDAAERRLNLAKSSLLEHMAAQQQKSTTLQVGDTQTTFTYTTREVIKINEVGLRKALGARIFNKYTKRVLDKQKMESAMENGEVDPMTVAQFVSSTPSAPYLRVSEKTVEE
jgi:hypothetical protein